MSPTRARPPLSVVVISHRWRSHPAMVDACLESIRRQTLQGFQLIVQFCEAPWPEKVNDAVEATRGERILLICDDDLLGLRTALEELLNASIDMGAHITYGDKRHFQDGQDPTSGVLHRVHGEQYAPGKAYRTKLPIEQFAKGCALPLTCLITREWWNQLDGYDIIANADTDFWLRTALAGGKLCYLARPVLDYREHPGQLSRTLGAISMRAYFRKHFAVLGVDLRPDGSAAVVPLDERAIYAAEHFTPFAP